MQLKQISTVLRRFSFSEKCRVCQFESLYVMEFNAKIKEEQKNILLPWELETFFLFSIAAQEWAYNEFTEKNIRYFVEIMNCIRENQHLSSLRDDSVIYNSRNALIPLAATQFDIQEHVFFKLFRYSYIFNFSNDLINMKKEFLEKFGCQYNDFLLLSVTLWLLLRPGRVVTQEILQYLNSRFQKALSHLTITRESFLNELSLVAQSELDYFCCFRPSYKYPFISDHGVIHLPLPHLLVRSCTSSLLFRIKDKNLPLGMSIGKVVLESYLFDIISNCPCFEEVYQEVAFYEHRKKRFSPDVMARFKDEFFFFESKSTSPKIDVRTLDQDSLESNIKIMAEGCAQIYKHLSELFPKKYNPFSDVGCIRKDNLWGVLVVLDDSFVERKAVYEKAAEILKIDIDSLEYTWFHSHVGISSYYGIERYCFSGADIVSAIKANATSGNLNDYWLLGEINNKEIVDPNVKQFQNKLFQSVHELAKNIEESLLEN